MMKWEVYVMLCVCVKTWEVCSGVSRWRCAEVGRRGG